MLNNNHILELQTNLGGHHEILTVMLEIRDRVDEMTNWSFTLYLRNLATE